jgi:hypothetical protein
VKRRKNKAHGGSRGLKIADEKAPKGRKKSHPGVTAFLTPLRGLLISLLAPTACAVGFILAPLRGWPEELRSRR